MKTDLNKKEEVQKALVVRFKKIKGQIGGIEKMLLDEGKTSQDIFIQLSAVRSALDKASMIVLENHMLQCLLTADTPEGLREQRNSLIHFIKHYKYGSFSSPYGRGAVEDLLEKGRLKTEQVIDAVLNEDEQSKCSLVLRYTSEIRDVLNSASIIIFEREVERSLHEKLDTDCNEKLDNILGMAKKFIM